MAGAQRGPSVILMDMFVLKSGHMVFWEHSAGVLGL